MSRFFETICQSKINPSLPEQTSPQKLPPSKKNIWEVILTMLEYRHLDELLGFTKSKNETFVEKFTQTGFPKDVEWICPLSKSGLDLFHFMKHPVIKWDGTKKNSHGFCLLNEAEITAQEAEDDRKLFAEFLDTKSPEQSGTVVDRLRIWFRKLVTFDSTDNTLLPPSHIFTLLVEYAHYHCLVYLFLKQGTTDKITNVFTQCTVVRADQPHNTQNLHQLAAVKIPQPIPAKGSAHFRVLACLLSGGGTFVPGTRGIFPTQKKTRNRTFLIEGIHEGHVIQAKLASLLLKLANIIVVTPPVGTTPLLSSGYDGDYEDALHQFLTDQYNIVNATNQTYKKSNDMRLPGVPHAASSSPPVTNKGTDEKFNDYYYNQLLDHPVTCRLFSTVVENSVILPMLKKPPGQSICKNATESEKCFGWGNPADFESTWDQEGRMFNQPWTKGNHIFISQKRVLTHGLLRGFWQIATGPYRPNASRNMKQSTLQKTFVHSAFILAGLMFAHLGPTVYCPNPDLPEKPAHLGRAYYDLKTNTGGFGMSTRSEEVLRSKNWASSSDKTSLWSPYEYTTFPVSWVFGTNRLCAKVPERHNIDRN